MLQGYKTAAAAARSRSRYWDPCLGRIECLGCLCTTSRNRRDFAKGIARARLRQCKTVYWRQDRTKRTKHSSTGQWSLPWMHRMLRTCKTMEEIPASDAWNASEVQDYGRQDKKKTDETHLVQPQRSLPQMYRMLRKGKTIWKTKHRMLRKCFGRARLWKTKRRMLRKRKTMEHRTRQDGRNTSRPHLALFRRNVRAHRASLRSWNALGHCACSTLPENLQLKCCGPGSRPTLCARLRNRNSLGHCARSTLCKNLQVKCRGPAGAPWLIKS